MQLFSKYELLVDCQRKAGQDQEAMQTTVGYLWEHASHLTNQLTTIVEIFVKAKRDAVKSAGDDELRTRLGESRVGIEVKRINESSEKV